MGTPEGPTLKVRRSVLRGAQAIQARESDQPWILAERRRDEAKCVRQAVFWHKVSQHLRALEDKSVAAVEVIS